MTLSSCVPCLVGKCSNPSSWRLWRDVGLACITLSSVLGRVFVQSSRWDLEESYRCMSVSSRLGFIGISPLCCARARGCWELVRVSASFRFRLDHFSYSQVWPCSFQRTTSILYSSLAVHSSTGQVCFEREACHHPILPWIIESVGHALASPCTPSLIGFRPGATVPHHVGHIFALLCASTSTCHLSSSSVAFALGLETSVSRNTHSASQAPRLHLDPKFCKLSRRHETRVLLCRRQSAQR